MNIGKFGVGMEGLIMFPSVIQNNSGCLNIVIQVFMKLFYAEGQKASKMGYFQEGLSQARI